MSRLSETVIITSAGEGIPSDETLQNEQNYLSAEVDVDNRDVCLKFSSRQALYDFAISLLQEAVFGDGSQKEFYPLISDGKALVVEGVRLVDGSSRIFVTYGEN